MNKNLPIKVFLIDGGPMVLKGNFEIVDAAGSVIALSEIQLLNGVALCRCGKSKTQPFCDGSHIKK